MLKCCEKYMKSHSRLIELCTRMHTKMAYIRIVVSSLPYSHQGGRRARFAEDDYQLLDELNLTANFTRRFKPVTRASAAGIMLSEEVAWTIGAKGTRRGPLRDCYLVFRAPGGCVQCCQF